MRAAGGTNERRQISKVHSLYHVLNRSVVLWRVTEDVMSSLWSFD